MRSKYEILQRIKELEEQQKANYWEDQLLGIPKPQIEALKWVLGQTEQKAVELLSTTESVSTRDWTKTILTKSHPLWLAEKEFVKFYLVEWTGVGKRVSKVKRFEITAYKVLQQNRFKQYGTLQLPCDPEVADFLSTSLRSFVKNCFEQMKENEDESEKEV